MGALVCDICGGKLVMGSGGIATCESCGMEHSQERMKEKVQEIKGTVRVDNTHMVDSWMNMGKAAAQAGNNKEAYDYFTKVIEIDPTNWRAIFEKGKAAAWQSTLANIRTSELYQGIAMALEIIKSSEMPEDEVVHIKNEFAVAIFRVNNAITDLRSDQLFKINDLYFDAHWDIMWNTRQQHITNVEAIEDAMTLIKDNTDDLSKENIIEFKKRICSDLCSICSVLSYWTDYSQSSLAYFGYKQNEKQKYLDKYWEYVHEIREKNSSYGTDKWSMPDPFDPGYSFDRRDRIFSYWQNKEKAYKEQHARVIAKKRFDDYWEAHKEDKRKYEERIKQIDKEIKETKEQLTPIDKRISDIRKESSSPVPATAQLTSVQSEIKELNAQKSKLGLFAGKQKKEIQAKIDDLQSQVVNIEEMVARQRESVNKDINVRVQNAEHEAAPFRERITKLEKERQNLRSELTKPR